VANRPIRKLLIANRGEIAVRVARACEELGIASVAVASDADLRALHARVAGEVVALGPAPARESYLRGDLLIAIARERGCDAIHPGYGFLAQNASFARDVERAGLVFVGPPADAIQLMGDKISARRAMSAAGVPVVPGFEGSGEEDEATLRREAERLGYPVVVKATAGGGGRGMRVVRSSEEIEEAVRSARREAEKAFGDGRLLLERHIEEARHVEVQVLADMQGNCVHLFERDCSIQRRFQKVLEEAPSPFVDVELRTRMGETAVAAARACGYANAGTVEFLVGRDRSYHFLEMNTRIQVEHPVTELLTGLDLVRAQIRIAAGEPLGLSQEAITPRGHAMECRVNAEDPAHDFSPCSGKVLLASFAAGPGVRVDPGVESGDVVTPYYDSLLAKVIVHAEDRAAAIRRMEVALGRTAILGVATNLPFLRSVLSHPIFRAGGATTAFVSRELGGWRPLGGAIPDEAFVAMAIGEAIEPKTRNRADRSGSATDGAAAGGAWSRLDGFRPGSG
jgi:3-methylcrotonyl-CoA carboxylase alpha subunit